jgi:hypothetical protein
LAAIILFISLLVTITSLLGLFYKGTYSRETGPWAVQAIGQDCANLIVVSILLVCTYNLTKNSLRAYFVWLGAYIDLVYAFVIYAFFVHFNFLFLVYVIILGFSFYTLAMGFMVAATADLSAAFSSIGNARKLASALLMSTGFLFSILWLSEIVPNLLSGKMPSSLAGTGLWVNPIHVLDLGFVLPGMVITSVSLWKKKLWGYLMAVPLMTFLATMGAGIIATLIIYSMKGMPSSLPAGMVVGAIMMLRAYFSYLFLKGMIDIYD